MVRNFSDLETQAIGNMISEQASKTITLPSSFLGPAISWGKNYKDAIIPCHKVECP